MNNKKIAFIMVSKDGKTYEESEMYINRLSIPMGYEVELIPIIDNISLAESYNMAMKKTDAKYKVYLRQDVFIINKNFIYDLIDIFKSDDSIGMIGTIGSKKLSTDALWWNSPNRIGKLNHNYNNQMEFIKLGESQKKYEEVNFVDGFIVATQYDLKWRADVFETSSFYDLAQCVEFKSNGFKIVVGLPQDTWCTYDCKDIKLSDDFEIYRNIFLDLYSKNIFPLVSILIASYNQIEFLQIALESAINQTYRNIEIIVGDDSTNDDVKNLIQKYMEKYKEIIYINNNGPLGGNGKNNRINLFKKASGEYVSFLNHDDLYKEDRISKMINYFNCDDSITLVTSSRDFIDEKGNIINENLDKQSKNILINGTQAGRKLLFEMANFIGEPTTAIFKKELIKDALTDYNEDHIYALGDVVTWLKVLKHGHLLYINEDLSSFRIHENQNSASGIIETLYAIDWYKLIKQTYKEKLFLSEEKEYLDLITRWYIKFSDKLKKIQLEEQNQFNVDKINQEIDNILKEYKKEAKYKCNYCDNDLISYRSLIRQEGRSDKVNSYIIENCNLDAYMCPNCFCTDRERMYIQFIELEKLEEFNKDLNILHIAPESNLKQYIKNKISDRSVYLCGDLYPTSSDLLKIDITDIKYESELFDIVICSHVLEHIPNDKKAMEELYRVMKPGSWGILQVPIALNLNQTYENHNITTNKERLYHFGQEDHVRVYSLDYIDRLKEVGFDVIRYNCFNNFGEAKSKKIGLSENDTIYIVKK